MESGVDELQHRAARVVGVTYLLNLVVIIVAFSRFFAPYLVWNNVGETAQNLFAHERAFRLYLASAIVYGVGVVVLIAALYLVLVPISRGFALFATLCRLVYAVMWFVELTYFFGVLRVLGGGEYLHGLQGLAGLQVASAWDAYYVGLAFNGLGSALFAYLWFKSRYVPRTLAAWGVLSSAFEGVCAFAYLIYPRFGTIVSVNWYEMPLALFELALGLWILVRGLRPPAVAGQRK